MKYILKEIVETIIIIGTELANNSYR